MKKILILSLFFIFLAGNVMGDEFSLRAGMYQWSNPNSWNNLTTGENPASRYPNQSGDSVIINEGAWPLSVNESITLDSLTIRTNLNFAINTSVSFNVNKLIVESGFNLSTGKIHAASTEIKSSIWAGSIPSPSEVTTISLIIDPSVTEIQNNNNITIDGAPFYLNTHNDTISIIKTTPGADLKVGNIVVGNNYTVTIGSQKDVTLTGNISAGRLIVNAPNGNVTVNGSANINLTNVAAPPAGITGCTPANSVAMHVNTTEFKAYGGSGVITPAASGQLCVNTTIGYLISTGKVAGNRIHFHGSGINLTPTPVTGHIVYGPAVPPDITGTVIHIDSSDNLGPALTYIAGNGNNIYIVNVGNTYPANSRSVDFIVNGTGFIEIRNDYTSTGSLNLSPGTGGIHLNDAAITLSGHTFDVTDHITLSGAANIITASSVTLGNVTGTGNLTLAAPSGIVAFTQNISASIGVLDITGLSINLNADITTNGSQIYNGAISLGGSGARTITSSSGSIQTSQAVTGFNNFTVNGQTGVTTGNGGINIGTANTLTFNSPAGNININGNITNTGRLILTAPAGNVTVAANRSINVTSTAGHGASAAIYVQAITFTASAGAGVIYPGPANTTGMLCHNISNLTANFHHNNRINQDRYCNHTLRDLVLGTGPDTLNLLGPGVSYHYINSAIDPVTNITGDTGFNVFIINANVTGSYTFNSDLAIEFRGTNVFTVMPTLNSGSNTISLNDTTITINGNSFNPTAALTLTGNGNTVINASSISINTVNGSSATGFTLKAVNNVVTGTGGINIPNAVITLESDNGNITVNGNIDGTRLVLLAEHGTVTIGGAAGINVTSNGGHGPGAAIRVIADIFTAAIGGGVINPGASGILCPVVNTFNNTANRIAGGRYCDDHLLNDPSNKNWVYGTYQPVDLSGNLYYFIDSNSNPTANFTGISANFNLYIVNDVPAALTINNSTYPTGLVYIEFRGNVTLSGNVGFGAATEIRLNDGHVTFSLYNPLPLGSPVQLMGTNTTNSITAQSMNFTSLAAGNNNNLTLISTASIINIDGANNFTNINTLTLNSATTITQARPFTANDLIINAGGAVTLNNASNHVSTLSVTGAGGAIQFTNNAPLLIAGISGLTGANAANQSLTIRTTGAAANLTQSGAIVSTGTLNINSGGSVTLTDAANNVGTLSITGSGGAVHFTNNALLAISGISGLTGAAPAARNITIETTGTASAVTINSNITATAAAIVFNASGAVTQTAGIITSDTLSVTSSGGITLNSNNNAGAITLTNTAAGNVSYTSNHSSGITITANNSANDANVTITEIIGNLIIGAAGVSANGNGVITLTSETGNITVGGNISSGRLVMQATAPTGTVTVNSGVTVSVNSNSIQHGAAAAIGIIAANFNAPGTGAFTNLNATGVVCDCFIGASTPAIRSNSRFAGISFCVIQKSLVFSPTEPGPGYYNNVYTDTARYRWVNSSGTYAPSELIVADGEDIIIIDFSPPSPPAALAFTTTNTGGNIIFRGTSTFTGTTVTLSSYNPIEFIHTADDSNPTVVTFNTVPTLTGAVFENASVIIYNAGINFSGGIQLLGNGSITAQNITVNNVTGTNNADLTLTSTAAGVSFNTPIPANVIGNLTVTTAGAATINIGADIRTSGTQIYNSSVTTNANIILQGTTVSMGTLNAAANSLTINGNAEFSGGNAGALEITGSSIIKANITTTGGAGTSQHYHGPVTLGGSGVTSMTLTGSGNNDTIRFDSTLNSDSSTTCALTIANAYFQFRGVVGLVPFSSITNNTIGGAGFNMALSSVYTTGNQTYAGVVKIDDTAVNNNTAFFATGASSSITFNGITNSFASSLAISSIDAVILNVQVGSIAAPYLSALSVTGERTTINANNIHTTGNQSYLGHGVDNSGGAVVLGASYTSFAFHANAVSTVRFAGTVNSVNATARSIVINNAGARFDGNVGAGNPIGDITAAAVAIGGTGNRIITAAGVFNASGVISRVALFSGDITINAQEIITSSAANALTGNVILNSLGANNDINFRNNSADINLSAQVFGNGEINVVQTGHLSILNIQSPSGDIILSGTTGITLDAAGNITNTGEIRLTSASGAITGSGKITGNELYVTAGSGINLANPSYPLDLNNVENVFLTNNNSGNIAYFSGRGANNDLGIIAFNNAATGGGITIREATGNIEIPSMPFMGASGSIAVRTAVQLGIVHIEATLGELNIYGNIGDASRNGRPRLHAFDPVNISASSVINGESVRLLSDTGNVNVNGNIYVTSTNGSSSLNHDVNAAVYISADKFNGTGNIYLPTTPVPATAWVCAYVMDVTFTGNVIGGASINICYHTHDTMDVVYRIGPQGTFNTSDCPGLRPGYLYIQAENITGNIAVTTGNVFVVDIDDINGLVNTRDIIFTTTGTNSYIQFKGNYISSGRLYINTGTGGIRFNGADIELSGYQFETAGNFNDNITLIGGNSSITALGITIGNIYSDPASNNLALTSTLSSNPAGNITISGNIGTGALLPNNVTVHSASQVIFSSASASISVNGTLGLTGAASAPAANDSILFTGNLTLSGGNVTVNSGMRVTGNTIMSTAGNFSIEANTEFRGNYTTTTTTGVLAGVTPNVNIYFGGNVVLGNFTNHNPDSYAVFRNFGAAGTIVTHNFNYFTGTAPQLGNVYIQRGNTVILLAGNIVQINGATLHLEEGNANFRGAILNITAGAWHIGTGGTASNDFAGRNGTLFMGGDPLLNFSTYSTTNRADRERLGSRIITRNLNLTGAGASNPLTINNSGWAFIEVEGNVNITSDITSTNASPYDYSKLIIEMKGSGNQNITSAHPLGSLHVRAGSNTTLAQNLEIYGELEIEYSGPSSGVLNAGTYNVVMYAGLTENKSFNGGTVNNARTGRFKIINGPDIITGSAPQQMYAFVQQNHDNFAEFKKHPSSTSSDRVFFDILGNTVWQTFKCEDQAGVTFLFSTGTPNMDHHSFLYAFVVKVHSTSNENDRITLGRYINYPGRAGWLNTYDHSVISITPPNDGLPVYPAPIYLKTHAHRERFWNFNFLPTSITPEQLDIFHVRMYFSHAWHQRVTINDSMNLDAFPYYNSGIEGYFNYDWMMEVYRSVIYSFAEDGNGNGRFDRIRVQTPSVLNNDFSEFKVNVNGYTVSGYSLVGSKTGDNDDNDSFYIHLNEGLELYNGQSVKWQIINNKSLKLVLRGSLIGPDETEFTTVNTIPPRVSYALTLPGFNETYVRMSQPVAVYDNTSGTVSGNRISSHNHTLSAMETSGLPPYADLLTYPMGATPKQFTLTSSERTRTGALSYRFKLNSSPDISDLLGLTPIGLPPSEHFSMEGLWSLAVRALDWSDELIDADADYPSPKYPLDWNYSGYRYYEGNSHIQESLTSDNDISHANPDRYTEIFIPPYRVLTPEMMKSLEEYSQVLETNSGVHTGISLPKVTPDLFQNGGDIVTRRSTDVLISLPPVNSKSENYFIWPVWARFVDPLNPETYNNSSEFYGSRITDVGIIWDFDGTKHLERKGKIALQARSNMPHDDIRILWTTGVPETFRNPRIIGARGRGTGGLWIPELYNINGNIRMLYNYASIFNKSTGDVSGSHIPSSQLYNFEFDGSSIASGSKFEFVFHHKNNPDMVIARLDIPRGSSNIPNNWYTLVRPFGFDIQDMRTQRGGITILNNVINSNNKEVTYLRYHLVRPGRVTIHVSTLDGTIVKSLRRNEHREAGEWTDGWDGTNNAGRPVARGIYFIRIVAPDIDEIRKVMVIK